MLLQLLPKLLVVLDNTVMYSNHCRLHRTGTGSRTISCHMGMGIGDAGLPVSCPTGVTDPAGSLQRVAAVRLLDQIGETTLGLHYLSQLLPVSDCQTG